MNGAGRVAASVMAIVVLIIVFATVVIPAIIRVVIFSFIASEGLCLVLLLAVAFHTTQFPDRQLTVAVMVRALKQPQGAARSECCDQFITAEDPVRVGIDGTETGGLCSGWWRKGQGG